MAPGLTRLAFAQWLRDDSVMTTKPTDHLPLWFGLAGIFIGAAITGAVTLLTHKDDIDVKMIELSVGILRAKVTDETMPLREWAVDTLQKRADVRFTEAQRAALLKQGLSLGYGYTGDSYSYDGASPRPK